MAEDPEDTVDIKSESPHIPDEPRWDVSRTSMKR